MLFCIVTVLICSAFTLWVEHVGIRLGLCVGVLLVSCLFFRVEIQDLFKVGLSFFKK